MARGRTGKRTRNKSHCAALDLTPAWPRLWLIVTDRGQHRTGRPRGAPAMPPGSSCTLCWHVLVAHFHH